MSSTRPFNTLFPAPARFPPSRLAPVKLAGASAESTQTLRRILRDNQEKNHIFFNDKGFHKCV